MPRPNKAARTPQQKLADALEDFAFDLEFAAADARRFRLPDGVGLSIEQAARHVRDAAAGITGLTATTATREAS